ncbi:MAG TPA: ATP-binding protein, partial [Vicinamibacterales bacterium]|nr:ATP-binding protein [Vicinamibacterales bacterium]
KISSGGAGDLEEHFFTFNVAPVRDTGAAIAGLVAIAVDVTPQVQARRALRGAEERLDLTLDAAGVGHWDLRPDTGTVTRSLRHDQIFGYPEGAPDWTSGRFLHHVVREERARVAESFQRAVASGEIWSVECSIVGGDDVRRRIHLYGRLERVENDAPPRFLGVVLDVTERHDLLAREQAARTQAEHASRMKDEFLAILSHELRTPLNTIIGWTDVLSDGTPNAGESAEGLETIGRNARMLAHLIEDLLDMSRITAGTLQMDLAPVRVSEVLSQAVASVRPRAKAKGVTIHGPVLVSGEEGIVSADADRLQQVFLNVLGNAVKFTPEGGRIDLSIADAGPQVIVTVTDTGEGIAADFLPYIFERFRQADGGSTRPHGGLGLGLSLVKRLVALQGGTVTASSRGLGQGAAFRVVLPATSEPAGVPQAGWTGKPAVDGSRAALPSSGLAGLRILAVDDDWDTCEIVSRLLTSRGAEVVVASSAAEALGALGRQPFDLLVSDIGMPHEDGYDLIRQVRLLPASQGGNIPAVAVTAYARPEDRQRALDAGFQTHIAKPYQQADLLVACLRLTDPRA